MKKKMKLNDVKVSSFVTNLEANKTNHIKGGSGDCKTAIENCVPTAYDSCIKVLTTNGVIC